MPWNVFVAFAYLKSSVGIIIVKGKGKGKGKVHPITDHEDPEGSRGIVIHLL